MSRIGSQPVPIPQGVSIDLKGFRLGGGTGDGIGVSGTFNGLSVRNGTLDSWSGSGVALGAGRDARVEHVVAAGNDRYG